MPTTLHFPTTYAAHDATLTGRCSQSRKVANNTYLHRCDNGDIAVRLHNTDVVTFHADGTITLSTGGWFTVTTKARINDYLPGGVRLSSTKGRWFLTYTGHSEYGTDGEYRYVPSERKPVPFTDGIVLDLDTLDVVDGQLAAETVKAEDAENETRRKAIERYIRKTTPEAISTAFENGVGDCLFCQMGGDIAAGSDHLLTHLDEQYVMFHLALNAVRERGYRDPYFIMQLIADEAERGKVSHDYKSNVRKYLRKHLAVGARQTR